MNKTNLNPQDIIFNTSVDYNKSKIIEVLNIRDEIKRNNSLDQLVKEKILHGDLKFSLNELPLSYIQGINKLYCEFVNIENNNENQLSTSFYLNTAGLLFLINRGDLIIDIINNYPENKLKINPQVIQYDKNIELNHFLPYEIFIYLYDSIDLFKAFEKVSFYDKRSLPSVVLQVDNNDHSWKQYYPEKLLKYFITQKIERSDNFNIFEHIVNYSDKRNMDLFIQHEFKNSKCLKNDSKYFQSLLSSENSKKDSVEKLNRVYDWIQKSPTFEDRHNFIGELFECINFSYFYITNKDKWTTFKSFLNKNSQAKKEFKKYIKNNSITIRKADIKKYQILKNYKGYLNTQNTFNDISEILRKRYADNKVKINNQKNLLNFIIEIQDTIPDVFKRENKKRNIIQRLHKKLSDENTIKDNEIRNLLSIIEKKELINSENTKEISRKKMVL